jgi:hypothetical protein
LAYTELGRSGDGEDVWVLGIGGERGEGVFVGGEEFGVGGPGLALGRDVLAGVLLGLVGFCWYFC